MVIAIKKVQVSLPLGAGVNFHNDGDGKDLNFGNSEEQDTNTWVPYQVDGKQIKIQIKQDNTVLDTYYLWDDDYKLQCSGSKGMTTLITVSGSADVNISVTSGGIQANNS